MAALANLDALEETLEQELRGAVAKAPSPVPFMPITAAKPKLLLRGIRSLRVVLIQIFIGISRDKIVFSSSYIFGQCNDTGTDDYVHE